jgi:WD40 repeat protein
MFSLIIFRLLWRLHSTCFNIKDGKLAIYDERGQIYMLSIQENLYRTIRLASTPLSSITFLPSKNSQLITAYENGNVLLIDTEFDETIDLSLKYPDMGKSIIRILRAHPTELLVIMAHDDQSIALWDLNLSKCVRKLYCNENILDVRFEFHGDLISVALESTGVSCYRSIDCFPVAHYILPEYERIPIWTSYTSYYSRAEPSSSTCLNVVLGGDNGMLYIWEGVNKTIVRRGASQAMHCIGVVELPIKMNMAVTIVSISSGRLAILSSEGGVLIVDIEGGHYRALGVWTVVADISVQTLQGSTTSNPYPLNSSLNSYPINDLQLLLPFTIPSRTSKRGFGNNSSKNLSIPRDGRMACSGDNLVIVGEDGAVRLFDIEASIGCGDEVSNMLRTRDIFASKESLNSQSARGSGYGNIHNKYHTLKDDKKIEKKSGNLKKSKINSNGFEETKGEKYKRKFEEDDDSNANCDRNLFELAALSPKDKQINIKKLTNFLDKKGEFPIKYRPLIWRFLLQLPENSREYSDLVRRGIHPAYENLYLKYPVEDKRMYVRLQSTCSLLAHWSPIFAEVTYLPQMVFPFILTYGNDELAAFESIMTILMWW